MATIQQLKTQIENANALGRTNLAEKGVELPAGATTYNIMTAIAEIVSGGGSGTEYTSIVYNTDNTVTLTDKDGAVHTMSCTYADGKLIGVTYDGKAVELTYNGDVLVKVGKTAVDVMNIPVNIVALDHTVTFTVDGEPYEVVSVKSGNSVNKPYNTIEKDGFACSAWKNSNEELISFPYKPKEDVSLFGVWLPAFDGLFLLNCDSLPVVECVSDLKPSVNKVTDIADGKFNSAIVLGSKKWLKYVSNIFAVGTNDYTLECWAKPNSTSAGDGKLFAWYDGSNGDGFFTLKKDRIIWYEKGSTLSADINIDDGQFHHIAFVRRNQEGYIYVDGIKVASEKITANLTNNALYIGVNGAMGGYESEYFDGLVDDIAFFDYAKYTENFTPRTKPYAVV